jgi:NAD(P) transhydrogenase
MQRLHVTLQHEIEVMKHQLVRDGIEVIQGSASFKDPYRVQVHTPGGEIQELDARKILIATGIRPLRPENIPFDDETVIDSDGVLTLKQIPKSMTGKLSTSSSTTCASRASPCGWGRR